MGSFLRHRFGFFLLALLVGLLVGASTVALIECVLYIQDLLFVRNDAVDRISWLANKSDWTIVLAPVFGGVIVGLILNHIPDKRFHGIADVMEASAMRAGRMDVRSGSIVGVATLASLGSGVPLGREGPAVHIGASMTAWLGEKLGLDRTHSISLLGCASAAAVTASFNTPIAGVIFALEVIVGYYALRVFAPVVVAAMGAVIIRHSAYGNVPEFSLPDFMIESLWELLAFALLGLIAAAVVQLFILFVISTQRFWSIVNLPLWCRPSIAGAVIGLMALSFPLILGVGYEGTSLALNEELEMSMLFGLLVAKTVCAALALGSGFAGGVFSPALFIGAMLGGSFWWAASLLGLDLLSSPGVYSVVGMAAVASAMLGAPISTLLIVFELTIDYDLVIAVMLAAAVASTSMQVMPFSSFFRWQLNTRGINLNTGRDQSLLRTRTIDHLTSPKYIEASSDASLQDVETTMFAKKHYVAVVVDEDGRFIGSLSANDVLTAIAEGGREIQCGGVKNNADHAIPTSSSLFAALQKMNELNTNYAPVTKVGEERTEVIGVLYRNDVLNGLYDLLRQARAEEYGVT